MNGSFSDGRPGPRRTGFGPDPSGFTLWDAVDNLRGAFEQQVGRMGPRMGRGDVRAAILALLAEQPMHGYQIIQEIEERSGGTWKPSPGSVYPTLQLLADEDLVAAEESDGKKTYSLTEAGRVEAEAAGDKTLPWETSAARDSGRSTALPRAGAKLAQTIVQVAREGSPAQIEQAVAVVDEARRKLFSILAQD